MSTATLRLAAAPSVRQPQAEAVAPDPRAGACTPNASGPQADASSWELLACAFAWDTPRSGAVPWR